MRKVFTYLLLIMIVSQGYSQTFSWAKSYGGIESDIGNDISLDASDNIYTVGYFRDSTSFNNTANNSLFSYGKSDIFIQKSDKNGEHIWAVNIGGENNDGANRILLDPQNNLVISGFFTDTVDFDPGINNSYLYSNYIPDQFILKLNNEGEFIWVNHLSNGKIEDFTIDGNGNIYSIGQFQNEITFEINGQIQTILPKGSIDGYIQKINPQGNTLWVKTFGSSDFEAGKSLRVDSEGNIFCVGVFEGITDLNPSSEAFILESQGEYDIFLMKLSGDGEFLWAKGIGSPAYDLSPLLEFSSDNKIYLTGRLNGNLFIHLIDISGVTIWEKEIVGNTSLDYINIDNFLVDENNYLNVTGVFIGSIDFDPSNESNILSTSNLIDGEADCFVAQYNNDGELIWVQQISGEKGESGKSLGLDSDNNLILIGSFSQTLEINSGFFSFFASTNEKSDIFLTKILNTINYNLEKIKDRKIIISPNPCSNYIEIDFEEESIEEVGFVLFNHLGQEIMRAKISKAKNQLKLPELPNGSYVVQFSFSPLEIIHKNIIIQKQ